MFAGRVMFLVERSALHSTRPAFEHKDHGVKPDTSKTFFTIF